MAGILTQEQVAQNFMVEARCIYVENSHDAYREYIQISKAVPKMQIHLNNPGVAEEVAASINEILKQVRLVKKKAQVKKLLKGKDYYPLSNLLASKA
jgi:hypothetical protein